MKKLWRRMTKGRYLKAVVTGLVIAVITFTIVMIACYFITGGVPDTLIDSFYRWCGIEGGATMLIEVSGKIWPKKEKRNEQGRLDEETEQP